MASSCGSEEACGKLPKAFDEELDWTPVTKHLDDEAHKWFMSFPNKKRATIRSHSHAENKHMERSDLEAHVGNPRILPDMNSVKNHGTEATIRKADIKHTLSFVIDSLL